MYYDVYDSTWLINKSPYKFKAVSFEVYALQGKWKDSAHNKVLKNFYLTLYST